MRILLVAAIGVLPLLLFSALRAVTGDGLSAVVFGLIIIITGVAWFAGRPVAAGELEKW